MTFALTSAASTFVLASGKPQKSDEDSNNLARNRLDTAGIAARAQHTEQNETRSKRSIDSE